MLSCGFDYDTCDEGNTQNGIYAESRDLYITTKRFSTAQFFRSILLLLHFI